MTETPRPILTNVTRLHHYMDHAGCAAVVVRSGKNFTYLAGFAYPGTLARHLDFGDVPKQWYLYDLFDNPGGAGQGIHMPKHGPGLYEGVVQGLASYKNIQIVKGRIPEIFSTIVPDQIAFLHLDLNDAGAEIAALTELFPRIVAGGMIVLDDYGWADYRGQQDAEVAFFAARGHSVLELATGQGLVIKR